MASTSHHKIIANILRRPRVTEKATVLASQEKNPVYTFEVDKAATKDMVAKAVVEFYKVKPVAVRMLRLPAKKVLAQGGTGFKRSVKKAMVFLKAGEKIESL